MATNYIRKIRDEKRLTREELARRVGTSASQITKLERGERRLTQDWIDRIAHALDVHPFSLLTAWSVEIIGRVDGQGVIKYREHGGVTKRFEVEAPTHSSTTMKALEVHEGLSGFAEQDSILFFDWEALSHYQDILGRMAVVWTTDGRVLVRRVYPGRYSDRWTLVAAGGPVENDVELKQAIMIAWIKLP